MKKQLLNIITNYYDNNDVQRNSDMSDEILLLFNDNKKKVKKINIKSMLADFFNTGINLRKSQNAGEVFNELFKKYKNQKPIK